MTKMIMPWQTSAWTRITDELIHSPITSITTMDSKISALTQGRIKPRQISNCFTAYFDTYMGISQEKFVTKIIPMMQSLLKNAPRVFRADINVLGPGVITNVALTRLQCATLITCIWFELFRYDYVGSSDITSNTGDVTIKMMPYVTFQNIYMTDNIFALACLINYFDRVYEYLEQPDGIFRNQSIIFKRNCVQNLPQYQTSLPEVSLCTGFVDDSPTHVHCISASASIGGTDFLAGSPTQEIVVLMTRPECIVAALLCSKLANNPSAFTTDTLTVFGAEKISRHRGVGSSVVFVSDYVDDVFIARGKGAHSTAMARIAVVFMDVSTSTDGHSQLIGNFDRDLTKAYCGMSSAPNDTVSCTNWIYGFNGANMQLRFLQLMLAAGYAHKKMVYHSVTQDFEDIADQFVTWLNNYDIDCNELLRMYKNVVRGVSGSKLSEFDVFEAIMCHSA